MLQQIGPAPTHGLDGTWNDGRQVSGPCPGLANLGSSAGCEVQPKSAPLSKKPSETKGHFSRDAYLSSDDLGYSVVGTLMALASPAALSFRLSSSSFTTSPGWPDSRVPDQRSPYVPCPGRQAQPDPVWSGPGYGRLLDRGGFAGAGACSAPGTPAMARRITSSGARSLAGSRWA